MTPAALALGDDLLAMLASPDGVLRPGFDHAAAALADRGAWTAWTFGASARGLIALGRTAEAETVITWLDALPLPADGPTGAVSRFAAREVQRLHLALRAGTVHPEGATA